MLVVIFGGGQVLGILNILLNNLFSTGFPFVAILLGIVKIFVWEGREKK